VNAIWKALKSFFLFWKDFLVADSPVLALGVIIILAIAYLIRSFALLAPVTIIILVLALITFTVWQKTRKRSPAGRHQTMGVMAGLCAFGFGVDFERLALLHFELPCDYFWNLCSVSFFKYGLKG
jgi:4-hydroxybenzoate polyprenyltransferase